MRFFRGAMAAACVVVAASGVQADPLDDAIACTSISDSLRRLTCFDAAFKDVKASQSGRLVNEPAPSLWEVTRSRSPIDDSPTILATLAPSESSGAAFGSQNVALALRCMENTTSVILSMGTFSVDDRMAVTIRLGTEPAETSRWEISSQRTSVGLWTGSQAIPFIKRLANGETLAVRVDGRTRVDAVFDLSNVEDVAQEVSEACGWAEG